MSEHAPAPPADPNELPGSEDIYNNNRCAFLEFLLVHPELTDTPQSTSEVITPFVEPISTLYNYGETEDGPDLCRAELTQLWSTDIYRGEIKDGRKEDDP